MSTPHSYRQMPGTCIYVCECICVFTYHCLIVEGEENMPARPCPIRSVRSGPVRPVCPVRALGPRALERTGRTGQGRHRALAKSSLALSGPVRPVRSSALGPGRPYRTDRTGPDGTPDHLIFVFFVCLKSDGVVLPNKFLDQK